MDEVKLLQTLHKDLVTFLDSLIESFPEEGDLVIARFAIKDQFPIKDIMEYIIEKLLPLKSNVDNRDNNFFLENNILFEQLEDNKVNHFKKIWISGNLDDEDKDNIWKWFDRFLKIAQYYVKIQKT